MYRINKEEISHYAAWRTSLRLFVRCLLLGRSHNGISTWKNSFTVNWFKVTFILHPWVHEFILIGFFCCFQFIPFIFNPRDGPKDIKLRYLMKTGIMRRADIPIGKFEKDHKFETSCASYYLRYNDCLTRNMFDRKICRENENSVITCEHEQGLYPKPDDLIARLRLAQHG